MSIDTQGLTAGNIKQDVRIASSAKNALKSDGRIAFKRQATSHTARPVTIGAVTSEEKLTQKMGKYQKIGGISNTLFMGDMFVGGAAGWVANQAVKKNRTKLGTVLHGLFKAPFEALRNTRLKNIFELPANYLKEVSRFARSTEGGAAESWASRLLNRGRKMEISAKRTSRSINKAAEPVTKVVGDTVNQGFESLSKTGFGQKLESGMESAGGRLYEMADSSAKKGLEQAEKQFTTEAPDFWKKVNNVITFKKPATVAMHAELAPYHSEVREAMNATGPEAIAKMETAKNSLTTFLENAEGHSKRQGTKIVESLEKAISKTHLAHSLENSKGLAGLGKTVSHSVGNVKLMPAIIGVSAVAAIGAVMIGAKRDNAQSKNAFNAFSADIDDKNHPLYKNVKHIYQSDTKHHTLEAAGGVVSEAANGAWFMMPHAGMGMMIPAMVPGMLITPRESGLKAYGMLKQQEAGKTQLNPEQQLELTKNIIAMHPGLMDTNGKPKNGGIFNNLVNPLAKEIIARDMTPKQLANLMANDVEFNAMASKALESSKAPALGAAAPVAAAAAQTPVTPAEADVNRATMEVVHSQTPSTKIAADKPLNKVVKMELQHDGKLETLHKEIA